MCKKSLIAVLMSLCLVIAGTFTTYAQRPVILTDAQSSYPLGFHVAYLADPSGQLTIADVVSPRYAAQFAPSQQETQNFGFTKTVYWTRLRVVNHSRQSDWRLKVGFPNIHYVDLYIPVLGLHKAEGSRLPFREREVPHQNIIFKIPLSQMSKVLENSDVTDIYLRFQSEASMSIGLTLWTPEALATFNQNENLFLGAAYGILMVMMVYNLFIYFFLRERSYLYYALSMTTSILYRASMGGLIQYLLPSPLGWSHYAVSVFTMLNCVVFLQFMRVLLHTPVRTPQLDKLLQVFMLYFGAITLLTPLLGYHLSAMFGMPLVIPFLLTSLAVGLMIARQRYQPAYYFSIAWSIAVLYISVFSLARLGLIPNHPLLEYFDLGGHVATAVFLSLALANQIDVLKQEKVTAQAEAINNLQEANRVKAEFVATLQQQVTDRTAMWQTANEHLRQEIAEREQAEVALQHAKEKAEVANQAKSAFIANMSHELRSPLNAILGFTQLMLRSQRLDPEHLENLHIITRSGEHLLALINQVLDLSKIEAGKMTLNPHPFDLGALLNEVEDMFRLKADDKGLQLLFKREAAVPLHLSTDELKLRQTLINLLNNALKFTTTGGVTVRVNAPHLKPLPIPLLAGEGVELPSSTSPHPSPKLGERAREGWAGGEVVRLRFEVEDTGPGIPPDEMGKLFQAFEQTSSGRQSQEGTGLGLLISRKFAQLMGGDMDVRSQVGVGATFSFEIDAERLPDETAANTPAAHRVIALEPGQPRYRLLIVDDKPLNRRLLVKLLNPFGFELREAENGADAVQMCETWAPQLMWMDMRMPVMDGYEATKRIKSTPKGQATAVIALTASMLEEERAVTLAAGCDDFLRKPFREQEIFDLLTKHLGVRFVYEDEPPPDAATLPGIDLPAALTHLPPELLERLRDALEQCDMTLIDQVLGDLRTHQPAAADVLQAWAQNFQYERMLTVIHEAQP